ncbi:MAG TPA: YdbH domain-containing protein [Kofleriaceae bacterium]|nr:YdbH domain-containing protein [Kofleriaceae bacterium]
MGVAAAAGVAYVLLPIVVEHHIRAGLVERGFPHARLEVASIGLQHMQLRNVHLDDGLDLGTLDFDRGLSLLWRDVNDVSITHASVSTAALARLAPALTRTANAALPFRHAKVADSTLDVQGTKTRMAGTASASGKALEITIDVRDPSPKGWAVSLEAKVDAERTLAVSGKAHVLGGEVEVEPFIVRAGSDVVVHARGLQLAQLLEPTEHLTGSGLVDGTVALRLDRDGWSLDSGELHARKGGSLQVTDRTWRDRLTKEQSPFAVHAKLLDAVTDFQFDTLTAELAPPGAGTDLRLSTRGRGRRNHQELDVAIGIRGARDVAARLPGAVP